MKSPISRFLSYSPESRSIFDPVTSGKFTDDGNTVRYDGKAIWDAPGFVSICDLGSGHALIHYDALHLRRQHPIPDDAKRNIARIDCTGRTLWRITHPFDPPKAYTRLFQYHGKWHVYTSDGIRYAFNMETGEVYPASATRVGPSGVVGIRNNIVEFNGRRIVMAPSVIEGAYIFRDRILYVMENAPDDDGKNVVMVDLAGNLIWTIETAEGAESCQGSHHSDRFGYVYQPDASTGWRIHCWDSDSSVDLDIETGKLVANPSNPEWAETAIDLNDRSVSIDGQTIFASPGRITATYVFGDGVIVQYDSDDVYGSYAGQTAPLTSKQIEGASRNLLRVGFDGIIRWRLRGWKSSQHASGYTLHRTPTEWLVEDARGLIHTLDIETGRLSIGSLETESSPHDAPESSAAPAAR